LNEKFIKIINFLRNVIINLLIFESINYALL